MAEMHPGSWLGDSVEEFKKLPTWGKVLAVGTLGLVAFLGYSAYRNRAASSGNSQATSLQPTSNAPGSSSPFSMIGNDPLLPSNVNPLYDPQGNLVAFQQGAAPGSAPTSTATPPSQVGSTPNPPSSSGSNSSNPVSNAVQTVTNWFARQRMGSVQAQGINIRSSPGGPVVGYIPYGSAVSPTGSAVSGPSNNPQTKGVANSTQWIPVKGGYVSAADLTSTTSSNSSPAVINKSNSSSQTSTGGGAESWQSWLQRFKPQTYVPQVGDNMNEVAAKLGLKGGWQAFGVSSFEHGVPIKIPARLSAPSMPAAPAAPAMPGMPNIQQNSQGQSVSMPGISIHQSDQGQSIQVGNQQITQGKQP